MIPKADSYRSYGERYINAVRQASREDAGETDFQSLANAARYFQEHLLHNISSLAEVLMIDDQDSLTADTRAGVAAVIDELSVLAFDCHEVLNQHYFAVIAKNNDPAGSVSSEG